MENVAPQTITPYIQYKSDKDNNWFARIIANKGEDYFFSVKLTVDEVNRNAERILNDIIRGNIDYNKYGRFVIAPIVIDTLISYCKNKIAILYAESVALGYTYNGISNGSIVVVESPVAAFALNQQYSNNPNMQNNAPMIIEKSVMNGILQSISMHNNVDLPMYSILYNSLMSVNVTKAPHELYELKQKLQPYLNYQSKRY